MASSLPLVRDSIQAETLAADYEDSSGGALPPPRSIWGPKEDSVLAQGFAQARTGQGGQEREASALHSLTDRLLERLRQDEIRRQEDRQRRLQDEARRARQEKELGLQRLRENAEQRQAIEALINSARALSQARPEIIHSPIRSDRDQGFGPPPPPWWTQKDERNPWKDEADPSCPESSCNLSKEEPMIIQEGGLKDRKQDDAYFSSFSYDEEDEMDMANLEEKFGYTAEEFQSKNLPSIEEEEDGGYCTAENKKLQRC